MGNVAIFKGKLVKFLAKAGILVPARGNIDRSASPTAGETAFNTDAGTLEVYNGTTWTALGAGAGNGLVHPTFGSTFEYNSYNPSIFAGATYNTAIGQSALISLTNGVFNTAIGPNTLEYATSSTDNIAIGPFALQNTTSASSNFNIAIGTYSLTQTSNLSASQNVAIGYGTFSQFTTGQGNVAIGHTSGNQLISGSYNTFINSNTNTGSPDFTGVVNIGRDNSGVSGTVTTNNEFILGTINHRYKIQGIVKSGIKLGQNTNDTSYVTLQSATTGTPVTWTLPVSNGTSGQVLTTNGSGTLSWSTVKINNVQNAADTSAVYSAGVWSFKNSTAATSVTINDSGNMGIGTTDPGTKLEVWKDNIRIGNDVASGLYGLQWWRAGIERARVAFDASTSLLELQVDGEMRFLTNGETQRMLIDLNGNVSVGPAGVRKFNVELADSSGIGVVSAKNPSTSSNGVGGIATSLGSGNGAQNNTNCWHFRGTTENVNIWYLYGNGTSSFTSDQRLKKNIESARDGYAKDLCKLRVVKYNWTTNDDSEAKELGLIAQEVEQVFPGLVQEADVEFEGGLKPKVLKASVLPFMLLKAIQEQQTQIESMKNEIETLKSILIAVSNEKG